MTRWMQLMVAAVTVAAVACGSDVSSPVDGGPSATRGTTAGGDSTGGGNTGGNNGGNVSNGPVARMTLSPATLSVPQNGYGAIVINAVDAAGVRVVGKKATWTAADPSIVSFVADSGLVYGKAQGTTTVTATVDGVSATVTVTVTPPVSVTPGNPAPPVSEFALRVVVLGPRAAGADTSNADRVAGATVKLTRVTGVKFDTLATPVDAGTAVTDANGEAKFANLPGGGYTARVVPPAGSPFNEGSTGFGPPTQSNIFITAVVRRK